MVFTSGLIQAMVRLFVFIFAMNAFMNPDRTRQFANDYPGAIMFIMLMAASFWTFKAEVIAAAKDEEK